MSNRDLPGPLPRTRFLLGDQRESLSALPTIAAQSPTGEQLSLHTEWIGDRFRHQVIWSRAENVVAAIESIEGDEHNPWPPSPPWQQIEIHQSRSTPASWLAVGMAGQSHWSASIIAIAEEPQRRIGVQWDIACRIHSMPARLGHAFRWLRMPPCSPANWLWRALRLEPLSGAEHQVDGGACPDAGVIQLRLSVSSQKMPQTIRWKLGLAYPRLP